MISIAQFQERALTGPVMKDREFDKALGLKLREVVSRYEIQYDPECIIADDSLADKVFEAGVDLLADIGLHHRDTQRVVKFTKEEVRQIADEAWNGPRKETFGRGKDAVTVHCRTAEDPRPPVVFLGTMSNPSTEELYIPWLQSFIQEELSQGMTSYGTLPAFGGLPNKSGTPGEAACGMAEVRSVHEAARRAGRPDILFGFGSTTSPGAIMTLYFPGLLERHNGLIPLFMSSEQKLDWKLLVLSLCAQERGLLVLMNPHALMGALCRGAEDAAVMLVASLLGQLGYGHANFASASIFTRAAYRDRTAFWAHSAATRAAERHIGIPIGVSAGSASGAGTEMAIFENAGATACFVASGKAFIRGVTSRTRSVPNGSTGLEGRIIAETARAVAGMPRDKANELCKKILVLYEDKLDSAPQGKTFSELYDIKTVQPTTEYLAIYQRAKERLALAGVPYR